MTSKVVVIVDDENLRGRIGFRAIEVRSRQTADAPAHHHQIVGLACIDCGSGALPEVAVAQRVRVVIGSVVAAAHSGERWRIVTRTVLRKRGCGAGVPGKKTRTAYGHRNSIQKVAARDGSIHPQFSITVHASPPNAISLVSRYSSKPSAPPSRPIPLSFHPVKGTSVLCGVHSFTPTMPNSRRSAVRMAARKSLVQT